MKTTCLAKINNIIALCHIMDKYEEFKKNLIQSLPSIYNQSFLVQLKDISIKHRVLFGSTRAKKFYEENKQVIDIINQYSDIMSFINEINNHETGKANGSIQAFYEYISNSQTSIDKIKQVLEKLKSLGVETLKLSEDEDFTQQDFYLNPEFNQNETISFLDNIQVIPNCTGYIKYSTAGSNYKIIAMICYDEFASVGRTAILNSLVFDPNRLPNELDKENTFDIILKLGEETC